MNEKRLYPNANPTHDRFAFYHQNEALLFQYLLHEGLRAHQILKKKPNTESFQQMIGNLEQTARTWHAPHGHLPRLLHYCSLLSIHFAESSASFCKNLKQTLDRAYVIAQKCHVILHKEDKESLKLYASLKKEIRALMTLLFIKLYDFRDNACVLFFLLRYQEQFDALFRQPIIKKTFDAFFPNGIKQAKVFLIDKFSKKGFMHLIPFMEQKLEKLILPSTTERKKKNETLSQDT